MKIERGNVTKSTTESNVNSDINNGCSIFQM